jgi:acetyltransferase
MDNSNFDKLFNPDSIAVIGASRNPNKIGSIILKNLRITYRGKIFPVNPFINEIQGVKAYPKVSEIKEPLDLAIIAIPSEKVLQVLKDCDKKKVKFAIVISAGFKEIGKEGERLEIGLIKFLDTAKIRLIGPNCLGVINTNPAYNATFMDPESKPLEGKAAFISQSGALMSAIADDATLEKIGFSKIISIGNETDIDISDMLKALLVDPNTSVIALYLEGIENGREFIKSALEVSKKKVVVALKGGKYKTSAAAAASHTGSLAGNDISYELAFKRSGVISVSNIDDLFNFMRDAPNLKVNSDEVIIVTNAGGAGVLTTDNITKEGLKLAKLGTNIITELEKVLPKEANTHNPIDILGDSTPKRYKETLEIIAKLNKPIIVLFSPQETSMPIETAKEISEIKLQNRELPILSVFLGGTRVEKARHILRDNGLPVYNYPHEAVDIIKGLYSYSAFLDPTFSMYNKEKIKKVEFKFKENLFGLGAKVILDKLNLHTVDGVEFKNETTLRRAVRATGYPCVMKLGSNKIAHKGEIGGIVVDIKNEKELIKAFNSIRDKAVENRVKPTHYELYKDANRGEKAKVELLLGAHRDSQFGSLIGVGLGGEYANILKETEFLLSPPSDGDISKFKSSKIGRLINEATKPKVFSEIISYMLKLARFMEDNPSVKDIDINPLFLFDDGVVATDFKIFV